MSHGSRVEGHDQAAGVPGVDSVGRLAYWDEGIDESGVEPRGLGDVGGTPTGGAHGAQAGCSELFGMPGLPAVPARSTNRQVAKRHWSGDEGGEDTADWGWLVSWNPQKLDQMREQLNRAQKCAQADDLEGALVRFGQVRFLVRPSGARIGGLYFAWILEREGWRLAMMDRESPFGETPNVRVHVGALPLMMVGLEAMYSEARQEVGGLGGEITGEKLSRIDPCLDLVGVNVSEFVGPMVRGEVVRRGRKFGVWGDGLAWSGFHVGQDEIRLRIYDKVLEGSTNGPKWDAMIACRFGGENPEQCTRVEWQLRRKALKEFGVETVADWIDKRAAVLDYLNSEWFRLTDSAVDRGNTQRFGPSELWQTVCEGFSYWAGVALMPAERSRVRRAVLDVSGLVRQAIGCFTSAAAVRGRSIQAWSDVQRWVNEVASGWGDELQEAVLKRFKFKRVAFEALYPC